MAKVRTNYAEKWARVTPQRTEDYTQGVANPRADWASQTEKAGGIWGQAVQQAIQGKRFEKGVKEAGTDKWKKRAMEVGSQRFGQGVQASQDEYEKGFKPYADVIEKTSLPPRYPKGDPRNIERVKAIATALRNAKLKGV